MPFGFPVLLSENNVETNISLRNSNDDFHFVQNDIEFLIEGVLLNKKHLLQQYALSDFQTLILELFRLKKFNLLKEFEGEFRGFIWDKKENKFCAFTNPTSTQRVFYTQNEVGIFIDNDLHRLSKTLKSNGF